MLNMTSSFREEKATMKIRYSISLWNFTHYTASPSLEHLIPMVREQGYGIELWPQSTDGRDLYSPAVCKRLKPLVKGMSVSLHSTGCATTFKLQKKQIDAAATLKAKVIVLHQSDFTLGGTNKVNVRLARQAVNYAARHGVKLALENGGELPFLERAISEVEGLGICLDVGHVFFTRHPMSRYLRALKHHIIHLHIQDILPNIEKQLAHRANDHFIPGSGGIPLKDWLLLARTLKEIKYNGLAVLEIRPRNPFQTALLGRNHFQNILRRSR